MGDVTNATTMIANITSPFVEYEFPCSYLGKPLPIPNTLPLAALGQLRPPNVLQNESAAIHDGDHISSNLSDNSITTTITQPHEVGHEPSPWLSCPRRTIDGIRSETILESQKSVAELQRHYLSSLGMPHNMAAPTAAAALAVEIWFTPILQEGQKEEEGPLLPILSIGASLTEMSEILQTNGSTNGRHDPCENTQLLIGQRGEFLELFYRDHYEYLPESFFEFDDDNDVFDHRAPRQYSCRVLRLNQWKLGDDDNDEGWRAEAIKGLRQLVVAWKESGSVLQIFGNGKSIIEINLLSGDTIETNANTNFLRHWDPSFRLQLFSDSPRWFETGLIATRPNNSLNNTSETIPTTTDNKADTSSWLSDNTTKAFFPGAINRLAMYNQEINEDAVKTLFEDGLEKREDPFKTFFEDAENPFEPLLLIASSATSLSDDDGPFRGVNVTQGHPAQISVGASEGSNTTTALWDVFVELVTTPKYGDLVFFDEAKNRWEKDYVITARVGDRFLLEEGLLRTQIEYRHLREEYFSIPKRSYNGTLLPMADLPDESFSYRLIATKKKNNDKKLESFSSESIVLGRSEAIVQVLTIVHNNHPSFSMGLPEEVLQPEWQPVAFGARPWATLGTNVTLNDDKDYDIDRVRLHLWALEGTLTIDLEDGEAQDDVHIAVCSNPKPTGIGGEWICDGVNDRNMTILATPTSASRILSNLKYEALNWNTSDTLTLRIFDGSGSLCLGESDHKQHTTIRDWCFSMAYTVKVPPMYRPEGPLSRDFWRDHKSWWISLVVFLATLFTTCCCAISCWRRFRRIKKRNDIAVADCEDHVDLATPEGDFPSSLEITDEDRRAANISDKDIRQMEESV